MHTPRAPRPAMALALLLACSGDPKGREPGAGEHTGTETETGDTGGGDATPAPGAPWIRDQRRAPGSITFNEILYHPAEDGGAEWIELYNPMALDMDLSGWSLQGGVRFTFPEGAVVQAGGFVVVASDPSAIGGALGPFEGQLSDGGERIELRSNGDRLIDTVGYLDDDPWPVAADGSGLSLAKLDPDAASDLAEGWTVSAELGGTPGAPNGVNPEAPATTVELVAWDALWRYDLSGADPATDWAEVDYDDGDWDEGAAIFYSGDAAEDVLATAVATADNYYGLYLGAADGSDLRLVGQDADGSWTSAETFDLTVTPTDHLYIAAWEAPWDDGGPQMTIAEVELPDGVLGTDATRFEWVLGEPGAAPGTTPSDPPPDTDELAALIADAEATASWAAPEVEADRSADPWGWATSGAFSADTQYIWADTFGSSSVTNTENTYALFRSVAPLSSARGSTELPGIPTTTLFRTDFSFDDDPSRATLTLACVLDDGAIVRLNGVEVLRENMPAGAVDPDTLASAEVTEAAEVYAEISSDPLTRGENVLSVELHQASAADADLSFGCRLTARISPADAGPTALLNEISAADTPDPWVELIGAGASGAPLEGLELASSRGGARALDPGELAPGELLLVEDLGFPVEEGDVLFLYGADRSALLDAVRVGEGARARDEDGGPWRAPDRATPGDPNRITRTEDVVVSEIQYHAAPRSAEGEPVTANDEEWIELYNRGLVEVDLSGWTLVDAVAFEFPSGTVLEAGAALVIARDAEAFAADHPGVPVLGDLEGRLDNSSDRILLRDARGNPADEVRYYDGGRWPEAADGGGSTLELRDVWADNASPEAWAASDESSRSEWVTVRYRGVAEASAVGPDGVWQELVLGLLDAGEVLIDDLSVIQDPDAASLELVQNGGFDEDAGAWRLLGNHRHSEVVPDPDDPSNAVLRLVATGPTGHMHNHAETTLDRAIRSTTYEISYKCKWISGANLVNTRLYFNRLPHTARVERPTASGTPGAPNSTATDNLGPTFDGLTQDVAVPAPLEPVEISVSVADPDGVASVTLWSAVNGGAFESTPMSEVSPGRWAATLEGQEAGALVQLYVEAADALGATATAPAAGPDSRALLRFDDGEAASNGLHNLRILMTDADSDWLHDDVNLMSDDPVGATVVYDEATVFYDVGVRAKGSERGRPETNRLGYGLRFHPDQPFRGSHTSALIDRSEGVGYGQREVLMNLVMTAAGSVSGEYNDLIQAMTPLPAHTGPAELQLDRASGLVLDAQFDDGSSGHLFEYELIYYPLTTDDGTVEGLKLPAPDSVVGTAITDLGDDPESYRWTFLVKNNEIEDDYSGVMALGQTFSLSGAELLDEVDAVIDVDQWLRAFAFATLSGAVDNYGGDSSQHNAQLYVRPSDQRVLYFPHDLDYFGSASRAVVGNSDLSRLLEDPANQRAYYGHLADIIDRAYNPDYLAPWCEQLAELLPDQDWDYNCDFVADRADWVMVGASNAVMSTFPARAFAISTGGGADFSVTGDAVTLYGEAWIDVREIALMGADAPLEITWLDANTWAVTVPLVEGANAITLIATDLRGAEVGSDGVIVTSTAG